MKGTFIHSWVSLPIKSEGRAAKGPCVPREPQPDQHPVSGAPAFTMPLLLLLQGCVDCHSCHLNEDHLEIPLLLPTLQTFHPWRGNKRLTSKFKYLNIYLLLKLLILF